MSKIIYFVVGVDLDKQEPFIDDQAFTARFQRHEQVWNTDTQQWEADDQAFLYEDALAILNTKELAKDGN
jgi:hypothetical protein